MMMPYRPLQLAAALVAAGLLAACGNDAETPATAATGNDTSHGRAVYMGTCSACHQPDGRGLRGAFPPLAGSDWLAGHPVEEAIAVVVQGLSGPLLVNGETYNAVMPPAAHLSDADIAAALSFVYGEWGNDGRRVSAEQVAAVRRGEMPAPAGDP